MIEPATFSRSLPHCLILPHLPALDSFMGPQMIGMLASLICILSVKTAASMVVSRFGAEHLSISCTFEIDRVQICARSRFTSTKDGVEHHADRSRPIAQRAEEWVALSVAFAATDRRRVAMPWIPSTNLGLKSRLRTQDKARQNQPNYVKLPSFCSCYSCCLEDAVPKCVPHRVYRATFPESPLFVFLNDLLRPFGGFCETGGIVPRSPLGLQVGAHKVKKDRIVPRTFFSPVVRSEPFQS